MTANALPSCLCAARSLYGQVTSFLKQVIQIYFAFVGTMAAMGLIAMVSLNSASELRVGVSYLGTLSVADYQGFLSAMRTLLTELLVLATMGAVIIQAKPQIQRLLDRVKSHFAAFPRPQSLAKASDALMLVMVAVACMLIIAASRLVNTADSQAVAPLQVEASPTSRAALLAPDLTLVAGEATVKPGSVPGEYIVRIKASD